jgi:hypothetical protein
MGLGNHPENICKLAQDCRLKCFTLYPSSFITVINTRQTNSIELAVVVKQLNGYFQITEIIFL